MTAVERSRAGLVRCRGSGAYLANVEDIINRPRGLSAEEEQDQLMSARCCDHRATAVLSGNYLQAILTVAERYQGLGLELGEMMSAGQEAFFVAVQDCGQQRLEDFPRFAIRRINQAIWTALPLEAEHD